MRCARARRRGDGSRAPILPRTILAHLRIDGRQRIDFASAADEGVSRFEVFMAARPPQTPSAIDDQRVADAAAKYRRSVCGPIHLARPWALLRMSGHETLDFPNEPGKKLDPVGSGRPQRLHNGIAEHRIRRRNEDARHKRFGIVRLVHAECFEVAVPSEQLFCSLQMLSEYGFGKLDIAKNFGKQTASDILAGVNRNHRGATIGMLEIVVTAADSDDLIAKALQGRNQLAPGKAGQSGHNATLTR